MAAALHPLRNTDPAKNPLYTRALINEFDFDDTRYPTHAARSPASRYQPSNSAERSREPPSSDTQAPSGEGMLAPEVQSARAAADNARLSLAWGAGDQPTQSDIQYAQRSSSRQGRRSPQAFLPDHQSQEPPRSSLSYALPPGASRRVVERYSLEDTNQPSSSKVSTDTRPSAVGSMQDTVLGPRSPQGSTPTSRGTLTDGRASPNVPPTSALRRAASPGANVAAANTSHIRPLCLCPLRLPTTRLSHLNIVRSRSSPPTSRRQTRPCKLIRPSYLLKRKYALNAQCAIKTWQTWMLRLRACGNGPVTPHSKS